MSNVPPPGSQPPLPPSGGTDIGAAISYGWKKFTENIGPLIAIVVIPIAVTVVLALIGALVVKGFFGFALFYALALLVSTVAWLGIFNAGLMTTRGERIDVGKAFTTDRWGEWIGFAIVYGLMLAVGYVFCFVGTLFVIAFFGLAPFYFLDQRKGIGDAISMSLSVTRENTGVALALGVLALIAWAGGLVCIGGLITYPLAIIGAAFVYRQVNNQPIAP